MDRFENMETFIRVVEAGSITDAAERLDVAKSAVSRRLKDLESHLGVELFHRTTRRMNLTDTGRAYYHQCVRILDDVLEAELGTSQAHGTLKGSLKVALPLSFGLMHLGPAINDFLKLHPEIEFDLDFNDRQIDVIEEGFDLAIRIARLPDSSLIARKLTTMQTVLCASPEYLHNAGTPAKPDDLAHHHCLVYSLIRDSQLWVFNDKHDETQRVRLNPYIKSSNGEYLRDAAVSGLGIILIPTFIAYQEIERGNLIPLLTEYRYPEIDAYALYPPTRHLSQRVRTFVDFLVARYHGTPYWDECLTLTE